MKPVRIQEKHLYRDRISEVFWNLKVYLGRTLDKADVGKFLVWNEKIGGLKVSSNNSNISNISNTTTTIFF